METIFGIMISKETYEDYRYLKNKNTPMKKKYYDNNNHCPICDYVVDNAVPKQKYCDRCGQRLKG